MLAKVNQRVGAEAALVTGSRQPAVRGEVVMTRGQIGIVINGNRILTESPGWLHKQHGVACL
ncbi:Uncharacterised protein [Mycobacteroides abscessus subsp. massiliense]|nr:Uncharacterised protein [Mycobacteroides abscessus subsp. massiliense]